MLTIKTREVAPDLVVVEAEGRIVLGPECKDLQQQVQELLGSQRKKIILDLGRVQYVDSAGVGVLVVCFSNARKAGGALSFAAAQPAIDRIFRLTNVDKVIPMFPTVEAAAQKMA